jgi:transposase-like protein
MPRPYTPEEKAEALSLLREKNGNVPYVSYLLGISERTLYSWRKFAGYEARGEQPRHWVKEQPERQERLQQQREAFQQHQQQRHQVNNAFGMTYAELEEALKVDYIQSPYANLHADMMLHLQHLNYSLTDEPETAHTKALAYTRMLDIAMNLESMVRVEKPQLSIIKYAYPDETYHDVPYWSNAIHQRAWAAYEAVVAEAKRQYEEQQAALKAAATAQKEAESASITNKEKLPSEELPAIQEEEEEWDMSQASLEEIMSKPFKPEDFIPKHTGFLKYFLGETPSARPKHLGPLPEPPNPDDIS